MTHARTPAVWICPVCESRTNLATDDGARIFCPNAGACWHHEADSCIRHLVFPHPWHGSDERIANKMRKLLDKHRALGHVRDDITGIGADTLTARPSLFSSGPFRTFRHPVEETCRHRVQGFCDREGILFVFPDPHGNEP